MSDYVMKFKLDDEGRAIYYADHEDTVKRANKVKESKRKSKKIVYYGDWSDLPDLVMEIIFSYLSFEHRYYCSLVCRRWYHAFHLPRVWSTFVFRDRLLSRRKYNLYMGWQYTLDHYRTHIFMSKFAKHIQTLVFSPMLNFFSLFGVMNMLGHFSERNCNFLSQVHTLKFTFSCDMADRTENAIYGTGGQMLKALQDLMDNLEGLCHVELINLLLESSEALYFLDGLCNNCSTKLHSLTLINTTKRPCQLLHPGVFLNLKLLYISPQNLGPDLIWLISHTRLRHLHIVQNTYTEWGVSVDAKVWINMVKQSRQIKVHLSSTGKPKNEIIWQERAPVSSILYESPYSKVSPSSVLTIIDLYRNTLETYGHLGQPRFHTSRSFVDRIDSAMITLVKECHKLHTLVVREHISTATVVLLAAAAGKRLRRLYVRRNALLLRADWPKSLDWSTDYFVWLRKTALSYEATQVEVSLLLKHNWKPLTDKEFKSIKISVHDDP